MSFTVPYTTAMRIGQGFNSYTQEICMNNAVTIKPNPTGTSVDDSLNKQSKGGDSTTKSTNTPGVTDTASTTNGSKSVDTLATTGAGSSSNSVPPSNRSLLNSVSSEVKTADSGPQTGKTADDNLTGLAKTIQDLASAVKGDAQKLMEQSGSGSNAHINGFVMPDVTSDAKADVEKIEATTNPAEQSWRGVEVKTSPINQIVTFSSRSVQNVSEIIDALNISASASIKYGTIVASGGAAFVNENKVIESDINYIVTVKVTNEGPEKNPEWIFNDIEGLPGSDFNSMFGDCFIAGFVKGGEFSAIISIKVHDKSKVSRVKAALDLTLATPVPGLNAGLDTAASKVKDSDWEGTEMSISVNWFGGGMVKHPKQLWDLRTVMIAANEFPNLVSTNAQLTSAILMRYTSLPDFHRKNLNRTNGRFCPADYTICGPYTQDLFSAYITYKDMWKQISTMLQDPSKYAQVQGLKDAIPADPTSLNIVRSWCRIAMTRIVKQINALAANPQATMDNLFEPQLTDEKGEALEYPAEFREKIYDLEVPWHDIVHGIAPKGKNASTTSDEHLTNEITTPTAKAANDQKIQTMPTNDKTDVAISIDNEKTAEQGYGPPRPKPTHALFPYPAVLRSRLPKEIAPADTNHGAFLTNSSPTELPMIQEILTDPRFCLDWPAGISKSHNPGNYPFAFVTKPTGPDEKIDALTYVSVHTHEHKPLDLIHDDIHDPLGHAAGYLSSIGCTLTSDSDTKPTCPCGCTQHTGSRNKPSEDEAHITNKKSVIDGVTKVSIQYHKTHGWIGALTMQTRNGYPVLKWSVPPEQSKELSPPHVFCAPNNGETSVDGERREGRWILGGFCGHADIVVNMLALIWVRV